jgi:MFS superfamily sulfate permease-like transporter
MPFIITIISIIFTDLLIGVGIGILLAYLLALQKGFQKNVSVTKAAQRVTIALKGHVTFLSKATIRKTFNRLTAGCVLIIDASAIKSMDKDMEELLEDMEAMANHRHIKIEKIGAPLV